MPSPNHDRGQALAERFRAFIRNPAFPCVGAKSALARGHLPIHLARDIASAEDDVRLHAALAAFVTRYHRDPSLFQSFAVVFENPAEPSERIFETKLWQRIQALSDHDRRNGHRCDPRVASDPDDPHFSLSLAGEAFFVVGLHPGASRRARRFETAVLVFNIHDQFEQLRAQGRYDKLRDTITARDMSWTGSANPMMAGHGRRSEAAQYSGRVVDETWRCPLVRRAGATRRGLPDRGADLQHGALLAPLRLHSVEDS